MTSTRCLVQPRTQGTGLDGLLLHGLQGGLGRIDLLLDLLEGLRLLQHIVPLTPHRALLSVCDSSEFGQEIASLRLRLLHPLTCRSYPPLPVGRVVSCFIENSLALFWRQSVLGLQLLPGLLQGI